MLEKAAKHIRGAGKLGGLFLQPSSVVGSTRYFVDTVFRHGKSNIYDPEKPRDVSKPNLVIVPGFAGDAGPYEHLSEELGKSANVYAPNTFPRGLRAVLSRLSIEEQAKLLLEYLEKFEDADRTGKKMNLVGHSNGGLVALLALKIAQTSDIRGRIGNIITMSTCLRPSEANHCGFIPGVSQYCKAVRDLRYDSQLFEDIKRYYDRLALCIVSLKDELFSPDMMYVDGGKVKIYNVGHYGLFDKKHAKQTAADIHEAIGKAA